jgi:tagaturonate reductase
MLDLPERVVQFGTGAFLRGFVEYFIDDANRRGAFDGRVVAVASTENGGGRHQAFAEQDGLYTLVTQAPEGDARRDAPRVIAAMSRALSAASQWDEVLACARMATLELVFSNTTEVGITVDAGDSAAAAPPRSFPGKLTRFLYERARAFDFDPARGVVVIPCELIEDNGERLRHAVVTTAKRWKLDARFVRWLDAGVPFLDTLVDRIVPSFGDDAERRRMEERLGYHDRLLTLCEPYRLFAIQADERTRSRLRFAVGDASIVLCDDVAPYRERKLHLLNGPHTIMAGIGLLARCRFVDEAMAGAIGDVVRRAMLEEIAPHLDVPDADEYAHAVLARFANPAIHHPLMDIMLHATTKLRVRVVPSILAYSAATQAPPPALALGFAALLLCLRDIRDIAQRLGRAVPADAGADRVRRAWSAHGDGYGKVVCDVSADEELWGMDLSQLAGFTALVTQLLATMSTRGVDAAIERVNTEPRVAAVRG